MLYKEVVVTRAIVLPDILGIPVKLLKVRNPPGIISGFSMVCIELNTRIRASSDFFKTKLPITYPLHLLLCR